jgi:tetratricopeptide (TPR) repeat protein
MDDNRGAMLDYNKAIEINPKFVLGYLNRSLLKGKLKDYQGAIDDLSRVIGIEPKNAAAYLYRGMAKNESGQKESGCLDIKKAAELGLALAKEALLKYCK